MKEKRGRLALVLAVLFFSSAVLPADADEIWTDPAAQSETAVSASSPAAPAADRVRVFLGVEGFGARYSGDFKGERVLVANDNSQAILMPELSAGSGGALRVGVRHFTRRAVDFGAELKAGVSAQDWKQAGLAGRSSLLSFDGNLLLYINTPSRVLSPYLSAGVFMPFLIIHNGAASAAEKEAAVYSGYGLGLGAGLEWLMGDHWALQGGVQFKRAMFGSVAGVDAKRFSLDDSLRLSVVSPRLALAWYF